MQEEAPRPRRSVRLVQPMAQPSEPRAPTAPQVSPALAVDDEHTRPTLEQRLDAAVLAAGATPPRGMRPVPKAPKSMVPLRLEAPSALVDREVDNGDDDDIEMSDSTAPRPRMLQFLRGDIRGGALADESVSRIPRLEPVFDSTKLPVAVGVHTNSYRLGGVETEETPSRPLPILSLDADPETLVRLTRSQVIKKTALDGMGVSVSSFSLSNESFVITAEGGALDTDRGHRSAAAVALHALSDEGIGELGTIDDLIDVPSEDLDELARQLGLTGLAVPRTTPPTRADDSLDGGPVLLGHEIADLVEIDGDDVELVAIPSPTDPMKAVVTGRPVVPTDAIDTLEGDHPLEAFDDDEPSHGTLRLPASLLPSAPASVSLAPPVSAVDAIFDDDEVTPPHGTARPSLEAPSAVRFVVAEAPARPRHAALSAEEDARNKLRARDLYLIALDDIGHQDTEGAIVHLQLAVAYDDETPVYIDLLRQLERKHRQSA